MSDENNVANKVELGEFPYPLTKGPEESRYLTWLRNHSNYMATRGFLDYFRMAGVLVRGVLLNFLVLLSLLLVVSLVVGHLYATHLRANLSRELATELVTALAPVKIWPVVVNKEERNVYFVLAPGEDNLDAFSDAIKKLNGSTVLGELLPPPGWRFIFVVEDGDGESKAFAQVGFLLNCKFIERSALEGCIHIESGAPINQLSADETGFSERLDNFLEEFPSSLWSWLQAPAMPAPFKLTGWVVVISLLWVVFSPILVVLAEIAGQKKSTERAGSDSSVRRRDWFERTFGFALLLIAAVALFEALPFLVEKFHHFRGMSSELNWNAIFASVASVSVVVMGSASKLLSRLGGAKKKLAMLLIGLLGLLLPLLVVIYVTEFLIYARTSNVMEDPEALTWKLITVLMLVAVFFVLSIWLAMLVGLVKRSFKPLEYVLLLGLSVLVIVVFTALGYGFFSYLTQTDFAQNVDRIDKWYFLLALIIAAELWLFCRLAVDVNRTSIHGLYRDRLASAYLVGQDTEGDVDIEEDVNLGEIGAYDAGSTAPYHLVNVALNLQGSKDMAIRDRNSDFFVFSKKFIGGKRTGYCRTETMEQVHPDMSLATAMAISAAAASPNMGRGTNPAMVAFMVLLNIRLGYWLPNPGRLEEKLFGHQLKQVKRNQTATKKKAPGFSFKEVFEDELIDVEKRWNNVYSNPAERKQRRLDSVNGTPTTKPTTEHGLVGIGFSGGGIRSATINLGIAQVLHERGIFNHVDYMSTVSGGGYLGSSISTLMRSRTKSNAVRHRSEIEGVVSLDTNTVGEKIVKVTGTSAQGEQREYLFSRFDPLVVKTGDAVKAGQELIERHNTIWDRASWRVKPYNLVREMMMKLDETHKWVNLSDGGHIENLAGIELLRRRCKFIIIGDGEADPELSFNGLATLIRYARIDLGITIDIDPSAIRVDKSKDAVDKGTDNLSREHFAFGTITYPPDDGREQEEGYLLYMKSSFSGDEDEVIKEYRHRNPAFPHESTADQFFNENQFESYRALGQHIGEKACDELMMVAQQEPTDDLLSSFNIFAETLETRAKQPLAAANALLEKEKSEKQKKWLEDFYPTGA